MTLGAMQHWPLRVMRLVDDTGRESLAQAEEAMLALTCQRAIEQDRLASPLPGVLAGLEADVEVQPVLVRALREVLLHELEQIRLHHQRAALALRLRGQFSWRQHRAFGQRAEKRFGAVGRVDSDQL